MTQTWPPTPAERTALKKSLRRDVRATRRARWDGADDAQREQWADALASAALAWLEATLGPGLAGRCVTSYESMPGEPPTDALNTALRGAGVRVLVPVTNEDMTLDWRDVDGDELLGLEGIAQADVVFTPGLSVGDDGMRLGQGGGCYDRTLPLRTADVPVVTLVWDEEFATRRLPRAAFDLPVDAVLTPDRGVVSIAAS